MRRVVFLVAFVCAHSVYAQSIPKVDVVYQSPDGSIFDRGCSRMTKTEIEPQAISEIVKRRHEFQEAWDQDGPAYLQATFDEIGLPFPYAAVQAHLTVCAPVGSMSDPLLSNVRRFLSTASPQPARMWTFALLLYHEMMHTYVRPVLTISVLRKKYAAELPAVQNHLHVMALEKFVLTKLGKAAELKAWDATNRTGAFAVANGYKRAWEIVNDVEGFEAFLAELKRVPRSVQPN